MNLLVYVMKFFICERLFYIHTFIRFFSPVWLLICTVRAELWEKDFPLITFIGFLTCMNSPMYNKHGKLREGFSTFITFIRFLSCMTSHIESRDAIRGRLYHIHYMQVSPQYELSDVQWDFASGWMLFHTHDIHKVSLSMNFFMIN